MKKYLPYLLICFYSLSFATDEDERVNTSLFQVECIIFKYRQTDLSAWEVPRALTFPNAITLANTDQDSLNEHQNYRLLDQQQFKMNREIKQLSSHNAYQIVSHLAWIQPISTEKNTLPIHLQTGATFTLPTFETHEINGCITISRENYFNLKADLYLTQPTQNHLQPEYLSYHLMQSRRTHSEELNYLDSPQLGVLIKIFPVSLPIGPETNLNNDPLS